MKNLKLIMAGVLVLIIAVSTIFYWNFRHSPQYSLKQAFLAVKNHDVATFEKHVELDKVLDKLKSDFQIERRNINTKDNLLWNIYRLFAYNETSELKKQIINDIESISNNDINNQQKQYIFNISDISMLKYNFKDIKCVKKEGVLATVGLSFFNFVNKQDYTMELIMRKQNGYWQLIELRNFFDILLNLDIEKNNILIENNGKFRKSYNEHEIIVKQPQFDARKNEIEKYLYTSSKIAPLNDFISSKLKNKNIINFFITYSHNTKGCITDYESRIDNNTNLNDEIKNGARVLLVSMFNNDFARAYFYFKDVEKFNSQEAIDRAYIQAYSALMCTFKGQAIYFRETIEFYLKNKNVEEKYVFVSTDEFMQIISGMDERNEL